MLKEIKGLILAAIITSIACLILFFGYLTETPDVIPFEWMRLQSAVLIAAFGSAAIGCLLRLLSIKGAHAAGFTSGVTALFARGLFPDLRNGSLTFMLLLFCCLYLVILFFFLQYANGKNLSFAKVLLVPLGQFIIIFIPIFLTLLS